MWGNARISAAPPKRPGKKDRENYRENHFRSCGTDPILSTQAFPPAGIRIFSAQTFRVAEIQISFTQILRSFFIKKLQRKIGDVLKNCLRCARLFLKSVFVKNG